MTLEHVLRVSLEATAVAALVGLLCVAVPRLRAKHRAILWWLVGAKLLLGFVPLPAVKLVALPATTAIAEPANAFSGDVVTTTLSPAPQRAALVSPVRVAGWLWLLGASLLTLAALPDWIRLRRWVLAGRVIDSDSGRLAIARARIAAGLRRSPRVLAVPGLEGPVVAGFLRPTVLVPAEDLVRLGAAELEMALAHEMAHVARGDLWLGLVPALARRIFFFHPAAWLAEREYAIAREAACDEAVLARHGSDPFLYGRLLLQLTTRRPMQTAIPLSPHSMLRRRLEMIETMVRRVPIGRSGWVLVAVAALALVPVELVAKEADGRGCLGPGSGSHSAYVITDGDSHTMCGEITDVELADAQRKNGDDVIWFRVGDQDWVIRDKAAVDQARQLFSEVGAIGAQQGAIGRKQSLLGAQQSQIGMQQGAIGMKQAEVAERQAVIALRAASDAMRQSARSGAQSAADVDAVRAQLAAAEKELAERQKAIASADSERQDEINTRMEELGARMEALGRQQDTLGEQQRALAETLSRDVAAAQRRLTELLEGAMRDGTALRVD